MGTTEKLARWIVDFDYSCISSSGLDNIKSSVLDTLGVALVGSVQPTGTMIKEEIKESGGNPQARLLGSGLKTSVLHAALGNGTFAHVEDYDDIGGFGHCGVVLTPPILALGEQLKLSGKKAMQAYAAGFEVGNRMRASLGEVQFQGGFHSTSLLGTLAAVAASAKLLSLDVDQTRSALGIASSMVSGLMQNAGTDTKALHAGHAARNGILAASLAKKGFTGDPDILEGPKGLFFVYGEEQADVKRVNEYLGKVLAISDVSLIVKAWPCCYGNHPALTAMFNILGNNKINPEEVESVSIIGTGRPSSSPLIRHNPKKGFEGKFSMEYSMATALVDGKIDLYSYSDAKLARPIIQELIKKVKTSQDPEFVDRPWRLSGEGSYILVVVKMKNGQTYSRRETGGYWLKGEEITAKFRQNTQFSGLSEAKTDKAIKLVKGLENIEDMTQLMDTLVV